MSSENSFFITRNGEAKGPFTDREVLKHLEQRTFSPFDLMRDAKSSNWEPIFENSLYQQLLSERSLGELQSEWVVLRKRSSGQYRQTGPFSKEELQTEIEAGRIRYTDYVWKKGLSSWKRLGSQSEFGSNRGPDKDLEMTFFGVLSGQGDSLSADQRLEDEITVTEVPIFSKPSPEFEKPAEAEGEDLVEAVRGENPQDEPSGEASTQEEFDGDPGQKTKSQTRLDRTSTQIRFKDPALRRANRKRKEKRNPILLLKAWFTKKRTIVIGLISICFFGTIGVSQFLPEFSLKGLIPEKSLEARSEEATMASPTPVKVEKKRAESRDQKGVKSKKASTKKVEKKSEKNTEKSVKKKAAASKPPVEAKKKPTWVKVSSPRFRKGSTQFTIRSNSSTHYRARVQFVGQIGEILKEGGHVYIKRFSKKVNQPIEVKIPARDLPVGYYQLQVTWGELSRELRFFHGASGSGFKKDLRPFKKKLTFRFSDEKNNLVEILDRQLESLSRSQGDSDARWKSLSRSLKKMNSSFLRKSKELKGRSRLFFPKSWGRLVEFQKWAKGEKVDSLPNPSASSKSKVSSAQAGLQKLKLAVERESLW